MRSIYKTEGPGVLDDNGFLRVRARFAKIGIYKYTPEEAGIASKVGQEFVNIYRPETEIFSPQSMATLEGLPATADVHEWQLLGPPGNRVIGSVAGSIQRDGDYLVGSILVTDPDAISRIKNSELAEISCGYISETQEQEGVYLGQNYDGICRNLRYNHVTILPPGGSRGGGDVKIIDNRGKRMDLVTIHTKKGDVNVSPESRPVFIQLMDQMEETEKEKEKLSDQVTGLEEKLAMIEELNAKINEMTAERDKIAGELEAVKSQLEEATSGAAMEEMAETYDACGKIMGDAMPKEKMGIVALRNAAAIHYAKKAGITVDSKSSSDYLAGIFEVAKRSIAKVPGHKILDGTNNQHSAKAKADAKLLKKEVK